MITICSNTTLESCDDMKFSFSTKTLFFTVLCQCISGLDRAVFRSLKYLFSVIEEYKDRVNVFDESPCI